RNRLMCSHELYKFNDGTLTSVRDKLKDMLNNLEMGYTSVMPRRRWSNLDKKRSRIMVKDIDHQLLERRLMISLETFVGGREYGEDLRLLQQQYDFNSKESPWQGFAAALAVLVTRASQSKQHESRKSSTTELFDVDSGKISIHHCEY
ncbi:hypothetical protein Tco_0768699, partial [Tanacetum coccineum]